MSENGISAAAFASPETVYYLTGLDHLGYFAFTMLVVPLRGRPALITRMMERPTIRAQVPCCVHIGVAEGARPEDEVAAVLADSAEEGALIAIEDSAMYFPPAVSTGIRRQVPAARGPRRHRCSRKPWP